MDAEEPVKLTYIPMGTEDVPSPETLIWRYMDLPKFVLMLKNRALYLSVVANLGDDFEAAPLAPPQATKQELYERWYQWSYTRATAFVSCWYDSPHESAAMWKLYGNNVAICTTFDALSKAISQLSENGGHLPSELEHRVFGGRVKYVNPEDESPLETVWNSVSRVLLKRKWFSHEKEIRLICERSTNFEKSDGVFGEPSAAGTPKVGGLWAGCDLKAMIQRVVVAPKSPPYIEEAVRTVVQAFDLAPSLVTRSALEKGVPERVRFSLKDLASIKATGSN